MPKEPSAVTWLWRKVKSATVVMLKMTHATRIYVAKVVMELVAANVIQEKNAGWSNLILILILILLCGS